MRSVCSTYATLFCHPSVSFEGMVMRWGHNPYMPGLRRQTEHCEWGWMQLGITVQQVHKRAWHCQGIGTTTQRHAPKNTIWTPTSRDKTSFHNRQILRPDVNMHVHLKWPTMIKIPIIAYVHLNSVQKKIHRFPVPSVYLPKTTQVHR